MKQLLEIGEGQALLDIISLVIDIVPMYGSWYWPCQSPRNNLMLQTLVPVSGLEQDGME